MQSCSNVSTQTGTNAVDDGGYSVEVKVMSPKEVREAADAVLLFLEENRSSPHSCFKGDLCEPNEYSQLMFPWFNIAVISLKTNSVMMFEL